jgi:hypothetical protein
MTPEEIIKALTGEPIVWQPTITTTGKLTEFQPVCYWYRIGNTYYGSTKPPQAG